MLYKEWTPIVYLRQDGRWWYVVRRIKYRGREQDDVLEVAVVREKIESELRKRGYRPLPGDVGAEWVHEDSPHI